MVLGVAILTVATIDMVHQLWPKARIVFASISALGVALGLACIPCYYLHDRRRVAIANERRLHQARALQDENEDEDDGGLKERIVSILFPGYQVDEESLILKKDEDDGSACQDGEESEAISCAICLEHIAFSDLVVSGASCSHLHHRTCILQWVLHVKREKKQKDDKSASCPTCRSPMWTTEEYEKAAASIIVSTDDDDVALSTSVQESGDGTTTE